MMQSKVHPTYKTKYRVANWPAYNQALVRRGDVTLWLAPEAIATWTPRRSGRRGGQRRYSDLAIETALTLRLIYHLPLRQAEGFLHSLFAIMRLDLCVSNSLSGRHRELDQVPAMGDPPHIIELGPGHRVSGGEGQRRVALQRRVAAYRVVVGLEVGKFPFKITGIPEQHMVEKFSPRRPDQALHEWV